MLHGSDWQKAVGDGKKTLFALPALQEHLLELEDGKTRWNQVIDGNDGLLESYGYETTPGVPIVAGSVPEPGRAGLILGAVVAAMLHRRRRALESG